MIVIDYSGDKTVEYTEKCQNADKRGEEDEIYKRIIESYFY